MSKYDVFDIYDGNKMSIYHTNCTFHTNACKLNVAFGKLYLRWLNISLLYSADKVHNA